MTLPKRHHTIPQFLLRNFAEDGKKQRIWVYDKWYDKIHRTSIKNVAVQSYFYQYNLDENYFVSLEESLSQLEAAAAIVVRRILTERTIDTLDVLECGQLAALISAQWLRTSAFREYSQQSDELIMEVLSQGGGDPTKVKLCVPGMDPDNAPTYQPMSDADHHMFAIEFMSKMNPQFTEALLLKKWTLLQSTEPLLQISDHPVCLFNEVDMGLRSNLGLMVDGIEIYMPLSTRICLRMLCPKFYGDSPSALDLTRELAGSLNNLQAMHGSRYQYAHEDNFDGVRKFLKENPRFKRPARASRAQ